MYSDNLFGNITYIIPDYDKFDSYNDLRIEFSKMTDLVKDLASDIGYSDMLIQFDNEVDLTHATLRLTEAGLQWRER